MALTYRFIIRNYTGLEFTYTIKPPNLPSPVPLPASSQFPPIHNFKLAPGGEEIFTSDIQSDSQYAHLFLILATTMIPTKEGYQPIDKNLLVDFWEDKGGLKGSCCYVDQVRGSRPVSIFSSAWESHFSWKTDPPAEIRTRDSENKRAEVIIDESSSQISS